MSHHVETMRKGLERALKLERARAPRLKGHLATAPEGAYKADLERHLQQTFRHQRLLRREFERLNGAPTTSLLTTATSTAAGLVGKAVGLVQGPIRAVLGNGESSVLEGAQDEARSGAELIAAYLALERIAANVGDTDVSHLARELHKEEEAMLARLGSHIPELANKEVPPTVTTV